MHALLLLTSTWDINTHTPPLISTGYSWPGNTQIAIQWTINSYLLVVLPIFFPLFFNRYLQQKAAKMVLWQGKSHFPPVRNSHFDANVSTYFWNGDLFPNSCALVHLTIVYEHCNDLKKRKQDLACNNFCGKKPAVFFELCWKRCLASEISHPRAARPAAFHSPHQWDTRKSDRICSTGSFALKRAWISLVSTEKKIKVNPAAKNYLSDRLMKVLSNMPGRRKIICPELLLGNVTCVVFLFCRARSNQTSPEKCWNWWSTSMWNI